MFAICNREIMAQVKTSDDWQQVPWRKLRQNLFRLQKRIFKAIREGDKAKARRLQRLVMSSYAARMLAIRQVTQLNEGKKTAGVDGKTALNFEERFQLESELRINAKNWKHQELREVPIPKRDGSKRILKVPTIADRAWQCLVKFALEPAHEATFHAKSYGFRPGRCAHDAQRGIFNSLNSSCNGINKRILELDIEKCFDRISHESILSRVIAPESIKTGLRSCLSAGTNPEFPEQGTPQGGVVSPLLANIALNGIESLADYVDGRLVSPCVRYADDMIFFLKPGQDENELLHRIEEFLKVRGMNISKKKTKVSASTDGFNFLGWNFYVQKNNGKLRSIPSDENFKAFRKKVKYIVNNSNYGAEVKAQKLASVVRGWRNYHKHCKMDGSRFSLWDMSYRAFKVFLRQKSITRYQAEKLAKESFPAVRYSENKWVNVKGDYSPFNGDLTYWAGRNSKLYDNKTAKALKKQNHSCARCGLKFIDGEKVHLHHVDGNHSNWKSNNLQALHQSCHQLEHMSKAGIA